MPAYTSAYVSNGARSRAFSHAYNIWSCCCHVLTLTESGDYSQLLETGTLHADPHPGNLIRTPDGKICILDYGSACSDLYLLWDAFSMHFPSQITSQMSSRLLRLAGAMSLPSPSVDALVTFRPCFPLHSLWSVMVFASCTINDSLLADWLRQFIVCAADAARITYWLRMVPTFAVKGCCAIASERHEVWRMLQAHDRRHTAAEYGSSGVHITSVCPSGPFAACPVLSCHCAGGGATKLTLL